MAAGDSAAGGQGRVRGAWLCLLVAIACLALGAVAQRGRRAYGLAAAADEVSFEGECGALRPPRHGEAGVPACTGARLRVQPTAAAHASLAGCEAWCERSYAGLRGRSAAAAQSGCCLYDRAVEPASPCSLYDGLPTRRSVLRVWARVRGSPPLVASTLLCVDDAPPPPPPRPEGAPRAVGGRRRAVGGAAAAPPVCSNGTCTVCPACCGAYIANGAPCAACVAQSCPALVCWPAKQCTACPACCKSYLEMGQACHSCVADEPTCVPPPSPAPAVKHDGRCNWRCSSNWLGIPRCGWYCGGKL
jgi:hypothetical protein